jgi:hypothetical protein
MVAGQSTFDAGDFSVPTPVVWYVRKPGWIRGPYSLADMRRFRDLGWLSRSEAVSRDLKTWLPAGQIGELWIDSASEAPNSDLTEPRPPVQHSALWRYSVDGKPCDEGVSFATLQILASLGRLRAEDLVWREGWLDWQSAAQVPGIHEGPSEWCSACGGQVSSRDLRCRSCGARLPGHAPPHAELCLACGVLGVVLFPAFPLWMIAAALGSHDLSEITKGRMDQRGENAARFSVRMGVIGGALFTISGALMIIAVLVSR